MKSYRKYCNTCLHKFSPRTFNAHQKICAIRQRKESISLPCLYCDNSHDCSYGSGVYCNATCMYADRKRYNKTCTRCQLTISINNYNAHVASCQGPKFNVDIWKISNTEARHKKETKISLGFWWLLPKMRL